MIERLLILGETGQLAQALAHAARRNGVKPVLAGRARADLETRGPVSRLIESWRPQVVINAAAYTHVDKAEQEAERAHAVNMDGAAEAAQACAEAGAHFIHVSTDYVFSGGGPHDERSTPSPINVYGVSKLAGERAVLDAAPGAAIVRAAGVFSGRGQDFPSAIWRLAHRPEPIRVVGDQLVTPVFADDLAERLLALAAAPDASGVFHCGGAPGASWCAVADEALDALAEAGGPRRRAEAIASTELPRPAQRPSDSRLCGTRLTDATGLEAPDWARSLRTALARWREMEPKQ